MVTSPSVTATAPTDLRQRHGHAGAKQRAELAARHPAVGFEVFGCLSMILIAHIRSLVEATRRGCSSRPAETLYDFNSQGV
jgi:hypothetical protein